MSVFRCQEVKGKNQRAGQPPACRAYGPEGVKNKGIFLWERLSRPPRLSESDGGQAAAILRFERFERP